jgi:hypothetical protein
MMVETNTKLAKAKVVILVILLLLKAEAGRSVIRP